MGAFLNSKKLKIVLLILVLILIGAFIAIIYMNHVWNSENPPLGLLNPSDETIISNTPSIADKLDKESEKKDKGEQIIYIPKEEVYKFTMTDSNGIELYFEKINDQWIYTDNTDISLNQSRIDNVLNYLCDIHSIDYIENANGEDYGLNTESKVFSIEDSTGDAIYISIGDKNDKGNIYFAVNYDFSTIYVNSGKIGNISEYAIQDMVQL
ncbi:protein of unknown function [Pseudobutyrivibrio sp. UC1225]|uniref:DUF4340 domain-containing protein n=1 Tax=Pseudobutyrivibrio sp. UC1225 TaxID=1798185 RepID=UPI0008EFA8CF|nr:DUF4340 domain-containing protein [Pseudobutyrivibrio sp. UC1225]SFN45242.1 protein of unknown function [Pseudobutyrivibrio sp. UC1225]